MWSVHVNKIYIQCEYRLLTADKVVSGLLAFIVHCMKVKVETTALRKQRWNIFQFYILRILATLIIIHRN